MIVSVDDLKAPLRIETCEEDAHLEALIARAQAAAEDYCRVSFDDMEEAPGAAQQAIILMACYHYEHPDMDSASYKITRAAFEALLYPHRDETKMF